MKSLTNRFSRRFSKQFAIDLSPLKRYPDFRNLWLAGLISFFGTMITMVALPYQIKELTNSYVAVGAIGAVELIPLIVFGLYGGVLADRYDRKKLIWLSEASALILVGGLLLNSLNDSPNLLIIYIIAALFSAVDGIQRPSAGAILPRLVSHEDLPAANALMSLRWQLGVILGPAVGGLIIATYSTSFGFLIDAITYLISLYFLAKVRNIPATEKSEKPAISALFEGVRYAFGRKDLLGTYLIDLAAMFFAMPNALFPFWVDQLDAKWSLGLFYAAGTVGSVLVTLTSGWTRSYRWHGRAVTWAAIGWGVAIALSGVVHSVWAVLFFLAAAGASDMVSALFRNAIWNQTIPDELRGRLAGIELISYSVGPLMGQMRAAMVATATSLSISVTSGGVMCVIFVALLASLLPTFRKYDVQTNEFAIREREIRKNRENF
ncbi:MAG: MFS transporter [Candidatus Nanopelagicaceae bacterium]